MESAKPIVVITGVSGYLGSYVCDYFLKDGSYRVRGTVRDIKNEKKIKPLRDAFGPLFDQLELVEADLLKPESLEKAIEGCTYVVHTASPFPLSAPKNEDDLIKPAVEGTLSVMRAALKNKVKRVVVTSSIASIIEHIPENTKDVYSEEDWSEVKACGPYSKSKTLAEKAAWDFLQDLPESERFELVVINPSFILGPTLIPGDFSSAEIISKIMKGKFPGMPVI